MSEYDLVVGKPNPLGPRPDAAKRMESIAALARDAGKELQLAQYEELRRSIGDTDLTRYFDSLIAEFRAIEARFEKIEATLYRLVDTLAAEEDEEAAPLDLEGNPLPAERDPNEPL